MSHYYRKAFLLDDDPIANYLLENTLEEHSIAGQILSFTSFGKFLEMFSDSRDRPGRESDLPDLLMLDLNMPGRDGLEVLETLLQIPGIDGSRICVFLMSASDNHLLREKIKAYPVSGFLIKPLREQALQQITRSALKDECELKQSTPE